MFFHYYVLITKTFTYNKQFLLLTSDCHFQTIFREFFVKVISQLEDKELEWSSGKVVNNILGTRIRRHQNGSPHRW